MVKKRRLIKLLLICLFLTLAFMGIMTILENKISSGISNEGKVYMLYTNGVEFALKGQLEKAEEQFRKARSIYKSHFFSLLALKTFDDFNNKIIDKEYIIHFFKGINFFNNKAYQQAIQEFKKAININPNYHSAYNCLGNISRSLDKPQEAIIYYEKAIHINPDYAQSYNNMGGVYFTLGQYQKALEYVEKALQVNPNDPISYYNLGLIYFHQGNYQLAKEKFQEAKKLFKPGGFYQEIQQIEAYLKKLP